MVAFNDGLADLDIVVSHHAAERWVERAGGTIDEAKMAIVTGIKEYGKLVMEKHVPGQGRTLYYAWNGLYFPMIRKTHWVTKQEIWFVKTTLLHGMVGAEKHV